MREDPKNLVRGQWFDHDGLTVAQLTRLVTESLTRHAIQVEKRPGLVPGTLVITIEEDAIFKRQKISAEAVMQPPAVSL